MKKRKKGSLILFALFLTCFLISCQKQADKAVPLRLAVIDSGFSADAIPEKNIVEGRNYLDPEASTEDTFGHGTAVASIILQEDPDLLLIPLVSSAYEDGHLRQVTEEVLAEMIRDAVDVYGCSLINISAGLQSAGKDLEEAVAYAAKKDVLLIAAAGNDYAGQGERKYYPAAYETVFAVGARNADGSEIADFSQRGDWVNGYEIGEKISFSALSGARMEGDGTSYAAAKVCGRAAALWKEHPEETAEKIFQRLEQQMK